MTDQKARASSDSHIIQSARDTNIGLSATDMMMVFDALKKVMDTYAENAREMVEQRLDAFRHQVLAQFVPGARGRPEAFRDPDFQYVLGRAQQAFARSGDSELGDILTDMVTERSMQNDRSRLTLTLNDAIEKSALLTRNEFAELGLAHVFRHTVREFRNYQQFINLLGALLQFVPDVSVKSSSYDYLESLGIANVSPFEQDFMQIIRSSCIGVVSKGFEKSRINSEWWASYRPFLDENLVSCLHDSTKLQFKVGNRTAFQEQAARHLLDEEASFGLWAIYESSAFTPDEFREVVGMQLPNIGDLIDAWDKTQLRRLKLTTVGQAIGHAAARRMGLQPADLGLWIT
ncbi:hypothetical protein ASE04_27430 [Rhizobium sp. Root708]|uniref:LPO_1073/Vpar_1526 family protein n=1 Tax=Rhizobium sp. Root708 TaxID=1736592 RepID=UPI0006F2B5CE|nr:LPO_1073/Vpar_1526 family protein [Rhizobium sp. Root708]KRB58449.1 hypothetical protein ASE04_27430 [Rhizobium sp. Root708]